MADVPNQLSPLDDPVDFRRRLKHWFRNQSRDLPWRENRSAYRVVVSEFMLQQTQVATVIPYYRRWMNQFPDWRSLAEASEDAVLKAWEGLGYYSRARNLHRLAQKVSRECGGKFPQDAEAMKKLPGIGPYTAGAVASLAFDQPEPILDGNVERVFARLFDMRGDIKSRKSQEKLWSLARALLPRRGPGTFNEGLMELGALICVPGTPRCQQCPVRKFCTATDPASLPRRVKTAITPLKIDYAFLKKGTSLWLQSPESPGRWKGFFRMPEWDPQAMDKGTIIGELKFSVTRYRIHARVVNAHWKKKKPVEGKWVPVKELGSLPLPAPVRRMMELGLKWAEKAGS